MGRVLRDLHRRKLPKLRHKLHDFLSRSDDAAFLQMAWSVNLLQSNHGTDVRQYLDFPNEAATTKLDSPFAIFKWDIETLVLLLLVTTKYVIQRGPNKVSNCRKFDAMAHAVNLLRSVESSEVVVFLDGTNVLKEMPRIGYQQFGWQRGFATQERLYRYAFIYGQGNCAKYFNDEYGLTVEDFMQVSFVLFALLCKSPWTKHPELSQVGISPTCLEKALSLLSRPLLEIRYEAKRLIEATVAKGAERVSYLPSVLRRTPVIRSQEFGAIIAPLPDLILFRATVGLYYDIRPGPEDLINEANDRFEQYTRKLIKAFCPRFDPLPSQKFGTKKRQLYTPDVLLKDGEEIVAVFECKATKLTYEAQYAENPLDEANTAYAQIIKGIKQLWQFFSRVRRGVYDQEQVAESAHGVLLTMDSWMQMSNELQGDALNRAKELLVDDPDVTEEDMRPIVFCSIQEFSDVLFMSNEDDVLVTLSRPCGRIVSGKRFGIPLPLTL
jgi:hypothetical protein